MSKRHAAVLAILLALFAAPLALGRHATVSASAQVDRTGTGYTLTLRNTGTEAIRCFLVLMPSGTTVSGAPSTADWQVTVTSTAAIVGYSLPGNTAAPGPGVASGGSAQISFTATGEAIGPSPAGQGMIVRLNPSNCAFTADSPQATPITGPVATTTTTTGTTTTAAPCKCASLTAEVTKLELMKPARGVDPADVMILRLHLQWTMQCTGGAGTCAGVLSVHGTAAETRDGLLVDSSVNYNATMGAKSYVVTCRGAGSCSSPQTGTATFYVAGYGAFNAKALGNKLKQITLIVNRTCNTRRTPLSVVLAFGADGRLDGAKSDLNGDRKPD